MPRRRAEARVRRRSVTLVEGAAVSLAEGGALLGVAAPTLRGWKNRRKGGTLGPNPLGRPPAPCDRRTRSAIEDMARTVGPRASVAYIRERFDGVPRSVVEEIVRYCKMDSRRARRAHLGALRWEKAGSVWSCDWTQPNAPIDGTYGEIFAVRDLASHKTLQMLPSTRRSSELAAKAVEHLFLTHGSPLILKVDGGSEFKTELFLGLMSRFGVTRLLSPEYYPRYNGAIEAGIATLKTHAWYEAAKNGRMGTWTCDDVEAGRLKANEISRPQGPGGPSPDMLWERRPSITARERRAFLATLNEERERVEKCHGAPRTTRDRKADERQAIQNALERCGYLTVVRRRVSLVES